VRRPLTAPKRRATVLATALAFGGLLVVLGAAPASAHASLVRSSPTDQSAVTTAPKIVSLTFDENIRVPSVILVTDADGAPVVQGKTSVVDNIVSTRVGLGTSGDYTVVYRVVSADGHPVSGRLSFGVGTGGGTRPSGQVAAVSHRHESTSTGPPSRVIGMVAVLALLGGLGLLTVRRWAPNLWSSS
jgi:copper resistance protein C